MNLVIIGAEFAHRIVASRHPVPTIGLGLFTVAGMPAGLILAAADLL